MAAAKKGTATPLGAVFSPDDTRRAVSRVAQAVADRRAELARVQGFFADNAALVSLVQRLPDELSHQIMVPFGGAAFFPGSLIHTNQLLVLLGDGYYADRSAKQTTEILHRRGMELETQMEAIKATISDLEAEAKFFESTAAEASEGLVEIREEYDEEAEINSSKSEASSSSGTLSDEEHARIMARFDELEMLEKEAGSSSENEEDEEEDDDDDDDDDEGAGTNEDDEENLDTLSDGNDHDNVSFGASVSGSGANDRSQGNSQLKSALKQLGGKEMLKGASVAPSASIINSEVQAPLRKAVSFKDENGNIVSSSKSLSRQDPKYSAESSHERKIISSGQKAFTGSIVEHDDNLSVIQLPKNNDSEKPGSSAPSRPVSRFKMQQGGR
ncbi:uncharacterized protein [Lolium perenne]|uniref:uncharacterized protein n=1 Tax=Lolium perenne TaxID=4522 RepID=UPI0021F5E030|nr:uncharacterized protein LOC127345490 [Lolium perenne]